MVQSREATILIYPRPNGQWLWASAGEAVTGGSLEDLAARCAGVIDRASLVLLVPGEEVLLTEVPMPTRHPERVRRALPYALEEHVLDDPARLHCAAGPRTGEESISCAAIDRERLATLLAELAAAGLVPDHAIPDCLCIPWEPDSIHVVHAADRTLVRWGHCAAAVSEAATAGILVEGIRAATPGADLSVAEVVVEGDRELAALCLSRAADPPLDLLQAEFLPADRRAGWRTWRLPATLAAAAVALVLALEGLQTHQLSAASATLGESIAQQFRAAFPHIGRVQEDPGPQVDSELRRLRTQAGATENRFLELLTHAAPALSAEPEIRLDRLHYDSGVLELGLTSGAIADLDRLRERLQAPGISAEQGAAQLVGGRVSGTIRIAARSRSAGT